MNDPDNGTTPNGVTPDTAPMNPYAGMVHDCPPFECPDECFYWDRENLRILNVPVYEQAAQVYEVAAQTARKLDAFAAMFPVLVEGAIEGRMMPHLGEVLLSGNPTVQAAAVGNDVVDGMFLVLGALLDGLIKTIATTYINEGEVVPLGFGNAEDFISTRLRSEVESWVASITLRAPHLHPFLYNFKDVPETGV